jgi:type I restriction enzyme, S subunit
MGSSAIDLADLSLLPLISKKQVARNPRLLVEEGWSLVTRSGTIGRMAYVRSDMAGLACSEDVLRVVPNRDRILPGYLYAFLSSKFGVPLVASGTYGAIIQHIERAHIADLPVPRFDELLERTVHKLVAQAAHLRADATRLLLEAQQALLCEIGAPNIAALTKAERLFTVARSSDISRTGRMEGNFYNAIAAHVESWARGFGAQCKPLGGVADVYDVPPFKHIYVDERNGVPFFTSGEIFGLDRIATKFLSRTRTLNLHKYLLEQDWLMLARSGQLGGIIGRPQYVDSALSGSATSDHVIRIVPKGVPGGYLYAYLYCAAIGYPLITRTMTGHSIPALWPSQLMSLPVVLAGPGAMNRISSTVVKAFEDRVRATELESQGRLMVEGAIDAGGQG